jgi:hypothetical protein
MRSVLSLDYVFDDELREFDHEPAKLGILLAEGITFRSCVLRATSARNFATVMVAVPRRRRYMRHD